MRGLLVIILEVVIPICLISLHISPTMSSLYVDIFAAHDSPSRVSLAGDSKSERIYTLEQFREMLKKVLQGKSADSASTEAGFPSACSSLKRYKRAIFENVPLQVSSVELSRVDAS